MKVFILTFTFFILQFQLLKVMTLSFYVEFWLFNNYEFSRKFDFYVQIVTFIYLNDLVCQFGLHVIIIYQSMIFPYVVELDF